MAQLVARCVRDAKAVSSSLTTPTSHYLQDISCITNFTKNKNTVLDLRTVFFMLFYSDSFIIFTPELVPILSAPASIISTAFL